MLITATDTTFLAYIGFDFGSLGIILMFFKSILYRFCIGFIIVTLWFCIT